jgi:hypothetical protein
MNCFTIMFVASSDFFMLVTLLQAADSTMTKAVCLSSSACTSQYYKETPKAPEVLV